MPVIIPTLMRLRQEDPRDFHAKLGYISKFKASQHYIVSFVSKTTKVIRKKKKRNKLYNNGNDILLLV